jgi:hypothetical protein
MPKRDDEMEIELGAAPTAITSVVPEQRNREATQRLKIPNEESDPEWASGAMPPAQSFDATFPQAVAPKPTLRQLWRHLLHEFKKLPWGTRTVAVASASALAGLVFGLIIAPNGSGSGAAAAGVSGPAVSEDELLKHARRLTVPERDGVVHALSMKDPIAALMMLRAMGAKDHLSVDPLALALRGRLALLARDGLDALDNFEAALTAQPKLTEEPWLAGAVVQTFSANKIARTTALLGKLPKPELTSALGAACMDWQLRVRHGAADALKSFGVACPDPVGSAVLDAYQADKCEAARAVVQKLLPLATIDDRVPAALDAVSRRPSVANCVAELIPRPGATPPPPPPTTK